MKKQSVKGTKTLSRSTRIVLGGICTLLLLLLLTAAVSIPFVFESQTIRYKFGFDKTLLRTGQMFGMIAGTLLFLQLTLMAHLKFPDQLFGQKILFLLHRINASCVVLLALMHPLFVFAPEDINNLAVELKYWPEMLGGVLLLSIWLLAATGFWRNFLKFSFANWRSFHRFFSFAVISMLFFHVLFVSESFESGLPRQSIFIAGFLYILLLCWVRVRPLLLKKSS